MSLYVEQTLLHNQRAIMQALRNILLNGKGAGSVANADYLDGCIKATDQCLKDIR